MLWPRISHALRIATATLVLWLPLFALLAQTPTSPKPLSKEEIIKLLKGDVPIARVETLAQERGIEFPMTPDTEAELRQAGANDALLGMLRSLAPQPSKPAPPTQSSLQIRSEPGGAHVYIDDEPMGTTSGEGRLRVSTLPPGEHRLRLSSEGYRDYERSVVVVAGQLVDVVASLERKGSPPIDSTNLTAEQIADRNVSAKGGLGPWRAVQTLSVSGKFDFGGEENIQLSFLDECERPRKWRRELQYAGGKAVHVYDGTNGWTLLPGRKAAEPFSAEELQFFSAEPDFDGFLVDYAAKGTQLTLEGTEKVEGRYAYKLKLTIKSGQVRHLWLDVETFLEVKRDDVDAEMSFVEVYYRDYKIVNGLMVPHEIVVQGGKHPYKRTIESVVVNPKLDDSRFAKPIEPRSRRK